MTAEARAELMRLPVEVPKKKSKRQRRHIEDLNITPENLLHGCVSLAEAYPEIAKQWHPTKNGDITPEDIPKSSSVIVWWLGTCGHEWNVPVYYRTSLGHGCPHCHSKTSFNEQALYYYIQQMCPDTINRAKIDGREADVFIPSIQVVGEYDGWWHNDSRVDADVKKAKHMQQQGMYFMRIREPACPTLPESVGKLFILPSTKDHDIENAIRWFLKQLQQLNPQLIMPDVNLARDELIIYSRIANHQYESSLAYRYPNLCEEWDWEKNAPITPEMVSGHSRRNVFWRCSNGHSYSTSPDNRVRHKNSCPYCNNHNVILGYNDLETTNPDIAKYWHPTKNGKLTPKDVAATSCTKVWWLCDCGHEYQQSPSKSHGKCHMCYLYGVQHGVNDLATTHPHLLEAWDYDTNTILPTQITANGNYLAAWKCPNGHIHYKKVAQYVKYPNCNICDNEETKRGLPSKKCMVQYADGSSVQYDSAYEAAISTGRSDATIRNYCNKKYSPPNNEQWCWIESKNQASIIATKLESGEKYIFAGPVAAAKSLGCDSSSISRCLHGKAHQTKGYTFQYSNS